VRRELLELAADLARRGEPFALATVVGRKPPMSAQVGDVALITGRGAFHGWVGGSCTRPTVESEAQKALADGRPRRIALDPDPGAVSGDGIFVFPMTCHSGGAVEIHIQPVLPAPRLLVYGVSPTARALARLAKAMGYSVSAIDPHADASAFPGADAVVAEPTGVRVEKTAAPVFAVVSTQGQWDEDAILAALAQEPDYLGVVASAKRFGEMRRLLAGKVPEAALARIKNPAGLDLGAQLPEEIAVSILAEIVKNRPRTKPAAVSAPSASAKDPVCGMTVRTAGAAHRAQHAGQDYFFCCAGCRERFLASPERYL
jgi:xanthine dehydrogenase accessory factor